MLSNILENPDPDVSAVVTPKNFCRISIRQKPVDLSENMDYVFDATMLASLIEGADMIPDSGFRPPCRKS
jgi:hypothetical protein